MNALRWLLLLLMSAVLVMDRLDAQEAAPSVSHRGNSSGLPELLARPISRWLLGGIDGAAVICFVLWWRRIEGAVSPMRSSSTATLTRFDAVEDSAWKARALAAEARAEKATALLRAKLMPQMARWMMTELVQRLLSHRTELVTSQNQAEQEVAELEKRLEKVHAPLAERLHAYERRIAELERELAVKGQENRELIEARILSARKKLESERSKEGPLTWN